MAVVSTFTAPPDWQAQQADIQRRLAFAQGLQQQGLGDLDSSGSTKMAGQIAIPNSWTQGLAAALKMGVGAYQQKQLAGEQQGLYQSQQQVYGQAGKDLMDATTPRAAVPEQPPTTPNDDEGNPNPPVAATPAYTPSMNDIGPAYAKYLAATGRNDLAAPYMLQDAQRRMMMSQLLQPDGGGAASTPAMAAPSSPAGTALTQGAQQGDVGPTVTNAARMDSAPAPAPSAAPAGATPDEPMIGGVPASLAKRLMYADPTGKLLAEQQAALYKQQQAPINVRQGGTVFMPGRGPIFSAPQGGIQTNYGPGGPTAAPVPGYNAALGGVVGAQEGAKLPFETVPMTNASGATIQTPKAQIPGIGLPPGAMPPQGAPNGWPAGMVPATANEPVSGPPQSVSQLPPGDQAAARAALDATAAGQPAIFPGGDPWATMPKLDQPTGMGQSTYQRTTQEASGRAAAALSAKYGDAANTANQRIATNNQALDMVDKADTGPMAAKIGDVKNWLVSRFGVPEGDFQNTPSATQALQKDLVNAATNRAKQQFGSRITQNEVNLMLTRGAPNVDMTKAAIKYLVGTDNAQAQYSIQQSGDLGKYLSQGGDPMRFEGWYAQAFPQTNAVSQVKLNTGGAPSAQDIMNELRRRNLAK